VQGRFLHDKVVLLSWTYQCTQYVLCVRPVQALVIRTQTGTEKEIQKRKIFPQVLFLQMDGESLF